MASEVEIVELGILRELVERLDGEPRRATPLARRLRRLLPEEHAADPVPAPPLADGAPARSGTGGTVPSTFATGYRYAGLGYTTAMEAAVAPLAARHAHAELDDTPIIDSGFYVLLGNDDYLLRQIAAGETARAREYAGWLLGVTRAYAIKIGASASCPSGWKAPKWSTQTSRETGTRYFLARPSPTPTGAGPK